MGTKQRLAGQVAIVTGASSGIGLAVAKEMALEGAMVVVNHVAPAKDAADAVVADIVAAGGKGMAIAADVSQEDQVIAMFAQTVSAYGTVDILVNNAGLQRDSAFQDMTLQQWNTVIGVNLTGQFLCAREAVREFLRRGIVPERSVAAGKRSSA